MGRTSRPNLAVWAPDATAVHWCLFDRSGRTETALTIFGITPATQGQILIDGQPVTIISPEAARDLGIAYIPEDRANQGLIRPQSVEDNIALANLKRLTRGIFVDAARVAAEARSAIQRFGIRARGPGQPVRQLSGGNQQKVVLAKWLFSGPEVLILDEPTRGIDVGAKYEIYGIINKLAEEGKAVIVISSEMPELLGISDRIYVMNDGRLVAEMPAKEASQEKIMRAIMKSWED